MKAIETEYKSYRFRSRLEARWAVFMDVLGLKYEYEHEGFDLDGINYLPDFLVPELSAHVEIKPVNPTVEEQEKMSRLVEFTKLRGFIIIGSPVVPFSEEFYPQSAEAFEWVCVHQDDGTVKDVVGWDCPYLWCECPGCGKIDLQFDGRAERIICPCKNLHHVGHGYNYDSLRLKRAYAIARGYRFEPSAENVLIES